MLLHRNAPLIDSVERPEIMALLPPLQGKKILEVAAGIGRFTGELAKRAERVTALDLCPHFIEANRAANSAFPNIEWICADAMEAQFSPSQFDLIFISWLFTYLKEEEVSLLAERMNDWLKPGGVLFFRESCAAVTHFSKIKGYYAYYRSPRHYARLFQKWTLLKEGNIQAYEDLAADPFKCFWIYTTHDSRIGISK